MQDRTIDNALLALRKQIIRGDGEGLELVEGLLVRRGVHMPRVLPARREDCFKHGEMRRAILEALERGPERGGDIVRHVMTKRPDMSYQQAQKRVASVLTKMRHKGLVARQGDLWELAP